MSESSVEPQANSKYNLPDFSDPPYQIRGTKYCIWNLESVAVQRCLKIIHNIAPKLNESISAKDFVDKHLFPYYEANIIGKHNHTGNSKWYPGRVPLVNKEMQRNTGTKTHKIMDIWTKHKVRNTIDLAAEVFENTIYIDENDYKSTCYALRNAEHLIHDFENQDIKRCNDNLHSSEFVLRYGHITGIPDWLALYKNKLTLVDFKTRLGWPRVGSNLKLFQEKTFYQLCVYIYLLIMLGRKVPENLMLINLTAEIRASQIKKMGVRNL